MPWTTNPPTNVSSTAKTKVKPDRNTYHNIRSSFLSTKFNDRQGPPTAFYHSLRCILILVRNDASDGSTVLSVLQRRKRSSARNFWQSIPPDTSNKVLFVTEGLLKEGSYIPSELSWAERNASEALIQQPASVPATLAKPVDVLERGHDKYGSTDNHMIQERETSLPLDTVATIEAGGTPSIYDDAEILVWEEDADSTRDKPKQYSH